MPWLGSWPKQGTNRSSRGGRWRASVVVTFVDTDEHVIACLPKSVGWRLIASLCARMLSSSRGAWIEQEAEYG